MPADVNADAFDAQDNAEAFDEVFTDGTDTANSDALDLRPGLLDSTSALGDEDDETDEALDADEISDEQLDTLEADSEEDDLDDDDADAGPLAVDDITDFTSDVDMAEEDGVDGVGARSPDEAEVIAMGDVNDLAALGTGEGLADLEPDDVSDEDLEELGYTDKE